MTRRLLRPLVHRSAPLACLLLLAGCTLTLEPVRTVDAEVRERDGGADAPDAPRPELDGGLDARGDAPTDAPPADDVPADDVPGAEDGGEGGCVPRPEVCNGADDDCDGTPDNVVATCGVGACRGLDYGCEMGRACAVGAPSPEVCNGIDDDCDGMVDDVPESTACGLGACARVARGCVGGRSPVCTPGAPSDEVCGNGADDDCDGLVDDGCDCTVYVAPGPIAVSPRGTIDAPYQRIQDGINAASERGGGTVCVAAMPYGTTVCGLASRPEFTEFTMARGVSVVGGFLANAGSFWTRAPDCRTRVNTVTHAGVTFGPGLGDETALEGFEVRSSATHAATAAISMASGGVVADCLVLGGPASDTGIGIRMHAAPGASGGDSPRLTRSIVRGGRGTYSIGVDVLRQAPRIESNVRIEGRFVAGTATSVAVGVRLADARNARLADNALIAGGPAALASPLGGWVGVVVSGASAGVRLERNGIVGAGQTSRAAGVAVLDATGEVTLTGNEIEGGAAALAAGVGVQGGTVRVVDNRRVVGSTRTGSDAVSYGVFCRAGASQPSDCTVARNLLVTGAATPVPAVGVWVSGVRDGGSVGVARADIVGNAEIVGCQGAPNNAVCTAVGLERTSGAARSRVLGNRVAPSAGQSVGIYLRDHDALVANNAVHVGRGNSGSDASMGIVVELTDGALAPEVHSNTVVGLGGPAARPVVLMGTLGTAAGPVFRNNVAVCRPEGQPGDVAFGDATATAPRAFEHNDLFGCATRYARQSSGMLQAFNTATEIDALGPGHHGTLTVAPGLAPDLVHLAPDSPLRNRGTHEGAPLYDLDGDLRPAAGAFDVGCDELP